MAIVLSFVRTGACASSISNGCRATALVSKFDDDNIDFSIVSPFDAMLIAVYVHDYAVGDAR